MVTARKALFDLVLIWAVFTVLTGAFFVPHSIIEIFGTHAKSYKVLVSIISLASLALVALAYRFGGLDRQSFVFSAITRITSPFLWVVFAFLATATVFSYSSLMRHYAFQTSFDFAIFAQAIWNTWQGDLLHSSIKGGINLLGDHVSPILILFAPLYGLWNDPGVLLIFQGTAAASSIFPIYLIAKKVTGKERLSLLFVFAFMLYQPLRNAVRFDFHPELVGDPLILWAFYFLICDRLRHSSIFLFLVLMTKEVACAPVVMFGLYAWWFRKKTLFGVTWAVLAFTVFLLDVRVIAPYLGGQDYFYLSGNYLGWIDRGLPAFLEHIFQGSTLSYFRKMFLPLGLFSFLSPSTFLLTCPILVQNLLAPGDFPRSTYFQYTTFLTPFVFVSAIYGFKNIIHWTGRLERWQIKNLSIVPVYWLLGFSLLMIGNSEYRIIQKHREMNTPHFDYIREQLRAIPREATLRTHMLIASHAVMRREIHLYENAHPREGGSERAQNAEYVAIDQHFMEGPIARDLDDLKKKGLQN